MLRTILPLLTLSFCLSGCAGMINLMRDPGPQPIAGNETIDLDVCELGLSQAKYEEYRELRAKQFWLASGKPAFRSMKVIGDWNEAGSCDVIYNVWGNAAMFSERTHVDLADPSTREGIQRIELVNEPWRLAQRVYESLKPGTPSNRYVIAKYGWRHQQETSEIAVTRPPEPRTIPRAAARVEERTNSVNSPDSSDVDSPSYHRDEDERKFALVVGIENYSSVAAATYASHDARAVRDHLLALGYPERNVILLTDQQATGSALRKYLETWLPKMTDEASTVFVYYSGHGAPDPRSGQAFLVPWDGDPQFLDDTAYPVSRFYQKLNGLKAKHVLVAMDACFSGAGGRSVLAKGARPLVTKAASTAASGRIIALTASGADEVSGTLDDKSHGAFTYFLLKGLNGAAADAADRVTTKGLFDYLRPKVADVARRENREQTPHLYGTGSGFLLR